MRSLSTNTPLRLAATSLVFTSLVGCSQLFEDAEFNKFRPGDPRSSAWCPPEMEHFPVEAAHNIGYDHASCGTGTCEISCPDWNANSDWGGDHHGIDVFAYQRAPLVAVAAGEIVAVGTPSSTSGLRVRLRDACGWEYYYGHMDEAVVYEGQWVEPGQLLGYMGYTGTGSTHLHFNVSDDGDYSNDINPFDLLNATSATACDSGETWTEEEEESPDDTSEDTTDDTTEVEEEEEESTDSSGDSNFGECGWATGDAYLFANEGIESCDGRFTLLMQDDGNLVLYKNGSGALWNAGTHGNAGAAAVLQADGNLVVYSAWGTALWWSGTDGHPNTIMWVSDNGDLVIYDGWDVVWNSGTGWY
ncbi:MAG: peptidoglycan DD-metalloendopeptidase family protein [Proteobacteria bacterium]|nr:peptidoglycan DD-metalloendopeptidase family protein [Pseudomonadota bacterium]MCP4917349.1 peptidoglycan DD-metalloendopeptidase family protein [Pseudomonadota bacterium]